MSSAQPTRRVSTGILVLRKLSWDTFQRSCLKIEQYVTYPRVCYTEEHSHLCMNRIFKEGTLVCLRCSKRPQHIHLNALSMPRRTTRRNGDGPITHPDTVLLGHAILQLQWILKLFRTHLYRDIFGSVQHTKGVVVWEAPSPPLNLGTRTSRTTSQAE